MRIMLVDDEPFVLKLLARQLHAAGQQDITACESAFAALERLGGAEPPVDLIFCDLQMPDMDGAEFLRHLADRAYTGSLILVSGESERILRTAEKLAQAHRLRVLGALAKPVEPAQLRRLLAQCTPGGAAPAGLATGGPIEVAEFAAAIAAGELENHYQPKIDLASGRVCGVETLVRWRHPEHGLIFPDRFIALAEENGLIDALTAVVLDAALAQGERWRAAGIDLSIAINVSMANLTSLDFLERAFHSFANSRFPLDGLVFEVTESRLMANPLAALEILTRLRLRNIGLSIDDFGTGHSSLAQLRDVPFNELKLDRSFIHGAAHDGALRAIAEGSTLMARQLGMKSVAEGIEDEDDWEFVRAMGCDQAQGYFIARPMPGDRIPDRISGWTCR
ncbi:MAG: Regulator of RpoS [Pseudomonadales bacterium]|nr:Regulator of RpoS [Pseudomonadales bacterium]